MQLTNLPALTETVREYTGKYITKKKRKIKKRNMGQTKETWIINNTEGSRKGKRLYEGH